MLQQGLIMIFMEVNCHPWKYRGERIEGLKRKRDTDSKLMSRDWRVRAFIVICALWKHQMKGIMPSTSEI